MTAKIYTVTGMTCEHCVNAVRSEVRKLDGIETVDVELATGRVTVTGEGFVDEQIRDAVNEAGYELAQA